jgi:hypothetical protein
MEVRMRIGLAVVLVLGSVVPAAAQAVTTPPAAPKVVNLSGPRVGFTSLSQGITDKLAESSIEVGSTISQFGWQFEKEFYAKNDGGVAAVNEWVVLLGGMEQGVVLPSVSWLVGLRTANGAEFGVGPNITPLGVSLAVAAGMTFRSGFLNVPLNVAVVPSAAGMRVSMLTGFNMRKR